MTRDMIIFRETSKLKPRLKCHHSSNPKRVTSSNLAAVGLKICKLESGPGNLSSNQFKHRSSYSRNSRKRSHRKEVVVLWGDVTKKHQIVLQDTDLPKN